MYGWPPGYSLVLILKKFGTHVSRVVVVGLSRSFVLREFFSGFSSFPPCVDQHLVWLSCDPLLVVNLSMPFDFSTVIYIVRNSAAYTGLDDYQMVSHNPFHRYIVHMAFNVN